MCLFKKNRCIVINTVVLKTLACVKISTFHFITSCNRGLTFDVTYDVNYDVSARRKLLCLLISQSCACFLRFSKQRAKRTESPADDWSREHE